jgi:putative transcription factor
VLRNEVVESVALLLSLWSTRHFSDAIWLLFLSLFAQTGAGGNASAHSGGIMSARKLEEATDVGTIAKVDKSLSKAIMQARTAKKMTQKELATAINEKPQVVAEYESGKAIPNPQIISKLERKLGTKLPRPGKSKLPKKDGKTTAKKPGQSAAAARGITRGGPPKRR